MEKVRETVTREAEFPILLYRRSRLGSRRGVRMYLVAFEPVSEQFTWSPKAEDALRCADVDADRLSVVYGTRNHEDLLAQFVA